MKAAILDAFGPSTGLRVGDLPRPSIGKDQLLLEVVAAAVNPIDWKIGLGLMAARYGEQFPMVLGFDASGTVAEVGSGVQGFRPGDEVFARSDVGPGGCYAEYAALNAATVAHKPAGLSHIDAAAMPLAALTALNGLRDVGELQPGQRVLVIGAAGGVGTYAVQVAKNMGAAVTGVCSGANLSLATELGADAVIDYTTTDPLATDLKFDVIYDTVGALDPARARSALTDTGVYITLVPTDGIEFFVPGQTTREAGGGYFLVWSPTAADLNVLADWARSGALRSVIDSVFDLNEIQAAHARSQTLHARGKIVVLTGKGDPGE